MKLMIVDDSNIIRRRIERINADDKFEVVASVGDGVAAVSAYKLYQPDIVTMDLTMPNMDGIECITRLVELNENLMILVVSALADKATAIEALMRGANGFLCKPFTDEELKSALEELVRGAKGDD